MTSLRYVVGFVGCACALAIACSSGDDDDAASNGDDDAAASGNTSGGAAGGSSGTAPRPDNPTACTAADSTGIMGCVSKQRYVDDVTFLASDVRAPGSPHWQESQDRCASTLAAHGFTVERHAYGTGTNVVGTLAGTDRAAETVVVGAHYDHITGCLGADDNATGVAGMLEIGRVLSGRTHRRTLAVACWDEEERGELGSTAWAKRAKAQGANVVQYVNFDMIGFASDAPGSQQMPPRYASIYREQYSGLQADQFRGNFLWTFFDKRSNPFARTLFTQSEAIGRRHTGIQIPTALLDEDSLQVSDHSAFWGQGWPAAHIGDTGDLRNAS